MAGSLLQRSLILMVRLLISSRIWGDDWFGWRLWIADLGSLNFKRAAVKITRVISRAFLRINSRGIFFIVSNATTSNNIVSLWC